MALLLPLLSVLSMLISDFLRYHQITFDIIGSCLCLSCQILIFFFHLFLYYLFHLYYLYHLLDPLQWHLSTIRFSINNLWYFQYCCQLDFAISFISTIFVSFSSVLFHRSIIITVRWLLGNWKMTGYKYNCLFDCILLTVHSWICFDLEMNGKLLVNSVPIRWIAD